MGLSQYSTIILATSDISYKLHAGCKTLCSLVPGCRLSLSEAFESLDSNFNPGHVLRDLAFVLWFIRSEPQYKSKVTRFEICEISFPRAEIEPHSSQFQFQ